MKVFIQSPDDKGRIDGSIQCNLLAHFPEQVTSLAAADVVIVPISFFHDFKFNPKIYDVGESKLPWVMIDFCETEWNYDLPDTHLFGVNTEKCRWFNPNWGPFDEWVRNHPPLVYFVRENYEKDMTDRIRPVEWPAYLPERPMATQEEFDSRPLEVANVWGYSNPSRPRLHAEIFHGMNRNGLGVISSFENYEGHMRDHPSARNWLSVFAPWFARKPVDTWRWFLQRAKIGVSLPGAGIVCFRSTEIIDCIMALQYDRREWSIPLVHGVNCIRLRPEHEFEDLEAATHRNDLYEIYRAAYETADKYRGKRYVSGYVIPIIEKRLEEST